MIRALSLFVAFLLAAGSARAIENVSNNTYNENAPTNTDIPNWSTGWAQPAVQPQGFTTTTGWNYVGNVNGSSAVYMGNNWVMTCAHVAAGAVTFNGVLYQMVPNSAQTIGTADIQLFQITTTPGLPALKIRSTDPVVYSTKVAMIGFGHTNGNRDPTWGWNTATQINQSLTPTGESYVSNDFYTIDGTTTSGSKSATNNYEIVIGDSGGAAFSFNTTTQSWELAGLCEVDGTLQNGQGTTFNFSGFVQLDTYAAQINKITAVPLAVAEGADSPTMPQWMLVAFGGLLVFSAQRRLQHA